MIELAALALVPGYYFLNRFRGTKGAGGAICGAITGAIVGVLTQDAICGAITGAIYFAGESVGWGRWLKTVPYWGGRISNDVYWANVRQGDRGKFIHKIANKIRPEKKDFARYAQMALYIRAAIWFPPLLTAIAVMGHANPIVAAIASGACVAAFPWSYRYAYKTDAQGYWGRGERFYGAVQGAALAATLIS